MTMDAGETPELIILCIDDEKDVLALLTECLAETPHRVLTASSGEEGLEVFDRETADLVLVDLKMAGMNGLEVLTRIKAREPSTEVVLMTAYSTVETAVEAMKRGARDYIQKPFRVDELLIKVEHIAHLQGLRGENVQLRRALSRRHRPENLVGSSPAMKRVYDLVERVAATDSTIVVQGETGTGKEEVVRAIHNAGPRTDEPFVPVDCSAISPHLFESELFGHIKGAFTGAARDKEGLLRAARRGTVFLDEVAEIPLDAQPKLLRALQEREVRPVGGSEAKPFWARVICATNRNLEEAVQTGAFREDLYYRIGVVVIEVPPLRERRDDILPLAMHFVRRHAASTGRAPGISEAVARRLAEYDWPGNVRELEHVIERALTLGAASEIVPEDLPLTMRNEPAQRGNDAAPLSAYERRAIEEALAAAEGNKRKAARILEISSSTLYRKMAEYEITPDKGAEEKG